MMDAHGTSRFNLAGLSSALLMTLFPLWITAGWLATAACASSDQRRRRVFILLWTIAAFFLVPVVGGVIFGASTGYAFTHGTAPIVSTEFAVGCSIAALFVGRAGYVLGVLGWLPGTKPA